MADPARGTIAVAGGGPVGAACVLALRSRGFDVQWVAPAETPGVAGARPLALSWASVAWLERLGVPVREFASAPIETIEVSQRGGFGRMVMTAREAGVPVLGCVASYHDVHHALLAAASGVPRRTAAVARSAVTAGASEIELHCNDGTSLRAALLVKADGGSLAGGAPAWERDYRAAALTAIVTLDTPPAGRAFERFSTDGPIALLPRRRDYALVWTLPSERAGEVVATSPKQFLSSLQEVFGGIAGTFTAVSERALHPLKLRALRQVTALRVVAIGNAAQSLHPVAGQGLNLGLRDARALAQVVTHHAHDPGAAAALAAYEARRHVDRWTVIGVTDGLARAFLPDRRWARALRGAGLTVLDVLPFARRQIARRMIFGAGF